MTNCVKHMLNYRKDPAPMMLTSLPEIDDSPYAQRKPYVILICINYVLFTTDLWNFPTIILFIYITVNIETVWGK